TPAKCCGRWWARWAVPGATTAAPAASSSCRARPPAPSSRCRASSGGGCSRRCTSRSAAASGWGRVRGCCRTCRRERSAVVPPAGGAGEGEAMPLLDHFHAPLSLTHHWESFHARWAAAIADALNLNLLPPEYLAEVQVHVGSRVEIDVATLETL